MGEATDFEVNWKGGVHWVEGYPRPVRELMGGNNTWPGRLTLAASHFPDNTSLSFLYCSFICWMSPALRLGLCGWRCSKPRSNCPKM